jgi:peptidoglycan/LPS O-acetylase OafA/YrhL
MRIKYIDVLKAFAIIMVVLYHAGVMTYGYLGVDLFLVFAGYLTTKSLSKKLLLGSNLGGAFSEGRSKKEDGRIGWRKYLEFEISRVIRLLPPLLVAGMACMALGYWAMLPDDYENLSQSVIATNFFGNNILAAITTKNYWDVVNEYKPLMHTWYVGIIMQFYIVYPILFYLANLDKKNPKCTLLTMVGVLAVISLLTYFGTTETAPRFYYLPSRFFEFAVGGICALVYKPQEDKPFGKWFVNVCYVLLLVLMAVNVATIPDMVRLVAVVALSCVLLCSQDVLANKVTGNAVLAKIGAASYSIFIWHQILLAFCRYTWTSNFTIEVYAVLLVATAVLSWLSYRFVEQGVTKALKSKKGTAWFHMATAVVLIALSSFAGYIYLNAGIVRDVPELYVSKKESLRMNHKAYNDKIYKLDKPFETDKRHWLVIGNSFGRDFANLILESEVADSIELSYIYSDDFAKPEKAERYANADRIFLSSLGTNEELVSRVEAVCSANDFPPEKLVIVGTKNFGESNGQFYVKRGRKDYFEQRTKMEPGYFERNESMKAHYGNRYLDLIGLVIDENRTMPVFTPDNKFISQDCRHFSKGGAQWFAKMIKWDRFY